MVAPAIKPDFDWITPYLAQGALLGTTVAQAYHAADVVIFCAMELQPDSSLSPPPRKTEIRLPFDDTLDATQLPWRDILRAVDYGEAAVRQQRRVMTMCAQGRNRSGLVSALLLMRIYGLSGHDAVELVRMRRHPRRGGPALTNPAFTKLIRERGPR